MWTALALEVVVEFSTLNGPGTYDSAYLHQHRRLPLPMAFAYAGVTA